MRAKRFFSILLCILIMGFPVSTFAYGPEAYTVTVTVTPEGGGTVTGAGVYASGIEAVLTPTANYGYVFDHWTYKGTWIYSWPYHFTVNEDCTFEAVFTEAIVVEEGETLEEVPAGRNAINYGTITNNYGTIITNNGTVNNNYGTVTDNYGTIQWNNAGGSVTYNKENSKIEKNLGTVYGNDGTVIESYNTIEFNSGKVEENRAGGTIHTNWGTVDMNKGTIDTNDNRYGAATVSENQGTIGSNNALVRRNSGTVTTNAVGGIVENTGTVTTNSGEVYKRDGTVGSNTSTSTVYYLVDVRVTHFTHATIQSSGLKEAFDDTWIGEPGGVQTTTTVIIAPDTGYEINSFPDLPTNVSAQKNSNGNWTLTITSGFAYTLIIVPDATVKPYTVTVWDGTGGGSYIPGATVTITADDGPYDKAFKEWTTEDGVTFADAHSATTTFTMPAHDVTVTATYDTAYTLTVRNGTGGGKYAAGASVTITANDPPAGQRFKEWTNIDSGMVISGSKYTPTVTIRMPSYNGTVTATYEDIPATTYTITFENYDNTVLQTSVVAEGQTPVYTGETPTAPDAWWNGNLYAKVFDGWWPEIVPVTGDTTYTAQYRMERKYLVTFEANGGTGTMDTGMFYASNGTYTLPKCGFTPPDGMVFKDWLVSWDNGNGTVSAAHYIAGATLSGLDKDLTVTAQWQPLILRVSPEGTGTAAYDSGTFTATANEGYTFKEWDYYPDDSGAVPGGYNPFLSTDNPYTPETVPEGVYEAVFTANEYEITVDVNIDLWGTVTCSDTAKTGSTVRLTVTPSDGKRLALLEYRTEQDGTPVAITEKDNKGRYIFTMPPTDVHVYADFMPEGYYLAKVYFGTGGGMHEEGVVVPITAYEPETGKRFKEWVGAEGLTFTSGSATTAEATFLMPASDLMLIATYEDVPVTLTDGYYLIGPNWTIDAIDAGEQFAVNPGNTNEYMLTTTLAENGEIKVVHVTNNVIDAWYPDGLDNQYRVDAAHAGRVNIYFQTTYNDGWSEFGGFFYIEKKAEPEFKSQSLTLDGSIGVNFYMDLSMLSAEDLADAEKTYMTFDISGKGTVDDTPVPVSENQMNSKGTLYGFTCYVNSIQMADTITATFHYGDGLTVTKDYSIEEYIDSFAEAVDNGVYNEDDDKELIDLVHALADYGHYMQLFLADAKGLQLGAGNDQYMPMDTCYNGNYNFNDVANELAMSGGGFAIDVSNNDTNIKSVTYSVAFESETTIRLILKPVSGFTGDLEVNAGNGNFTVPLKSKRWTVEIPNIPAHLLGEGHDITARTDNSGGDNWTTRIAVINLSVMTYVQQMLNGNNAAKNAACAVYYYWQAAKAFKEAN